MAVKEATVLMAVDRETLNTIRFRQIVQGDDEPVKGLDLIYLGKDLLAEMGNPQEIEVTVRSA